MVDSVGQELMVDKPNPPTLPSLTAKIGIHWCQIMSSPDLYLTGDLKKE
jgi:hypothetical protein